MADIFISSAVRTAIGSFGGSLSGLSLSELATHVGKEAINRAGIAPDKIEQTVFEMLFTLNLEICIYRA